MLVRIGQGLNTINIFSMRLRGVYCGGEASVRIFGGESTKWDYGKVRDETVCDVPYIHHTIRFIGPGQSLRGWEGLLVTWGIVVSSSWLPIN